MNKTKKVAVGVAAAVCALTVSSMALTACSTDWTKYKYNDFAKTSVEKWDAKEIAYQFDGIYIDSTKESNWAVLINLYEDGSMAYLEGLMFKDHPDNWNWAISDLSVRWINYGYWTEAEDGNLELNYTHWYPDDPTWTDDKGQEFEEESKDQWKQTTVTKSGDSYTIKAGDLTLWFMGAGTNGGNVDSFSGEITGNGSVKYNSFSAWYDSWKANIPVSTGGPGGNPPANESDRT